MTQLNHEIEINASVEKVWSILSDLEQIQKYNPLVASAKIISQPREGLNAARRCDFKGSGFAVEKVTHWEPKKSLGINMESSSFPMAYCYWTTHLEPLGNKTRVSQQLHYKVKFGVLGSILNYLIMKNKYNSILNGVFTGLKKYAEQA